MVAVFEKIAAAETEHVIRVECSELGRVQMAELRNLVSVNCVRNKMISR